MNCYSIYDKKTGEYMVPFFCPNVVTALRSLSNALREKSNLSDYPADFCLYEIGRFDKDGGLLISSPNPVFVEEISNLIRSAQNV